MSPFFATAQPKALDDKEGTQWYPFVEWEIENPKWEGNPFDIEAKVLFVDPEGGANYSTEMFYAGDNTWKFRFTGTETSDWLFQTISDDPDLNGYNGRVSISENKEKDAHGFLKTFENKWGWEGTEEAFVPQLVMYKPVDLIYQEPTEIDQDISEFLEGHGFNGFHIPSIAMGWFDLEKTAEGYGTFPEDGEIDPDPRTFEALETLITKVHQAGGMVHLWVWGDEDRKMTPLKWGANGLEDQRLQKYIAARLGPLPGWSMGYGFDLHEWADQQILDGWYSFMKLHLGWPVMLGARSGKNELDQISELMDYSSYEQHRPDYGTYVETIDKRPGKPAFSEDRFRIRNRSMYQEKDYGPELTLKGLWHSTMAGGVANIWGNLGNPDGETNQAYSLPYPNKVLIKTYSTFFFGKKRFTKEMERANDLVEDGAMALAEKDSGRIIVFKEDIEKITFKEVTGDYDKGMVAVDINKPYKEVEVECSEDGELTFPYKADWAVANF